MTWNKNMDDAPRDGTVELVHEMNPCLTDLRWWEHTAQNYKNREIYTRGWNDAISHLMKKYGQRIQFVPQPPEVEG